MTHTHVLVIAADLDPEITPDYTIECPGVTDACRMWEKCTAEDCPSGTGDDSVLTWDADKVAHGERHRYINDAWMVPTDQCYLIDADEMPDVAAYADSRERLGAGRHEVDFDFDDGQLGWLTTGKRAAA